jgi:hypothetical protein
MIRKKRRNGIASLPVAIFFIALTAISAYAMADIASSQSSLASTQLEAGNTIAARQAQLNGLIATTAGTNDLQITQNGGVPANVVYALVQTSDGQTKAAPVSYVVNPGQTTTIDLANLVQSIFGDDTPSLSTITLVTSEGVYITSQVQTVQKAKQVTTYQQQQVQKTGSQLVGYDVTQQVQQTGSRISGYNVYQTSAGYYSCPNGGGLQGSSCVSTQTATWNNGYYSCPSGWSLSGSSCSQQQTYYTWVPGYYSYQQVPYYVPGYWSQYYVPGYWQTYQYWVAGFWTQYSYTTSYSYQTWQWVSTGGYWAITWYHMYASIACLWGGGLCVIDILLPFWHWIATGYWSVVTYVVYVVNVVDVWHPGYWTTGQYWVSGYWSSYYVPGYWTTQTIQVWHPGYYQANTRTVTISATWNPGFYSCPSGGSLSGVSCVSSYSATWNPPTTVYLGQQISCPAGSQYSCSAVYSSYTYWITQNLGQMSYCPSGSVYSCTAVYQPYTYSVTETVPITQTVYYKSLSSSSTWLVGG